MRDNMSKKSKAVERVSGLDVHPDSFTAAILEGWSFFDFEF
jgi:hypothetical protein